MKPRARFGPDGSITNLDEIGAPEPKEYAWCWTCGHEWRVHLIGEKCQGLKAHSGSGDDEHGGSYYPCPCERFVARASDERSADEEGA